ncbi:MAG: hypothetical protein PHS04_18355 [Tissierellia bacterium]|nr:hypothetical protein [Tissierellia bacterium]
MSELDLIKKLERLSAEKPNKDWVSFTRESILSSNPEIQKTSFERLMETLDVRSLTPMMICIFAGLIFGGVTTLFTPGNEKTLMTAAVEEGSASVAEIASTTPVIEEEPLVANTTVEKEDVLLDEQTLATMLNSEDEEIKKEGITYVTQELERMKNDVKECRKLAEFLTGTAREECDKKEVAYNQYYNQYYKSLGEDKE